MFIQFNGDNVFEYSHLCLKVYGFSKIINLDNTHCEFKYKKHSLIIKGKQLKFIDFIDKSLQIKGVIESIEIKYMGGFDD